MSDSSFPRESSGEVRRLRRMLKELGELAQHSTLTGGLQGGAAAAVRRYNSALGRLRDLEISPPGFEPLSSDSGFSEVGVESASLAGYLREDETEEGGRCRSGRSGMNLVVGLAPFIDQDVLADLVKANTTPGEQLDTGLILALAPFLPREEISRLVQENLQTMRRQKADDDDAEEPRASREPQRERAAGPDPQPRTMVVFDSEPASLPRSAPETPNLHEQLESLARELGRGGLPDRERNHLLSELTRLSSRVRESQRSLPGGDH